MRACELRPSAAGSYVLARGCMAAASFDGFDREVLSLITPPGGTTGARALSVMRHVPTWPVLISQPAPVPPESLASHAQDDRRKQAPDPAGKLGGVGGGGGARRDGGRERAQAA